MSTTNFQLIYDGKALENHEINPRDLSIALNAINDLFTNADRIVNKGKTKAEIKVKASFETGCFKINFSSSQSILEQTRGLFISDEVVAILNAGELLGLIFGTATGLICLIKFLKGKKPDKIQENEDKFFSIWKDGKTLKFEKEVMELYKDYKLRKSFEDLVSPLIKDGIDDLAIKEYGKEDYLCQITKDEKDWFLCPDSKEEEIDQPKVFETYISIINLSFKEGNKWFVNDGNESFYIIVEDKNFLKRIDDSMVKFSKGDLLKIKIRKVQFYNFDKKSLRSEYFVEKVLEHKTPSRTADLFDNI